MRNTFFAKFFMTVGDWTARIWCDEIKTPMFIPRAGPTPLDSRQQFHGVKLLFFFSILVFFFGSLWVGLWSLSRLGACNYVPDARRHRNPFSKRACLNRRCVFGTKCVRTERWALPTQPLPHLMGAHPCRPDFLPQGVPHQRQLAPGAAGRVPHHPHGRPARRVGPHVQADDSGAVRPSVQLCPPHPPVRPSLFGATPVRAARISISAISPPTPQPYSTFLGNCTGPPQRVWANG